MMPNKRGNNQHLRSLSALANPEATAKLNGLQVLKVLGLIYKYQVFLYWIISKAIGDALVGCL